MNGSNQLQTRYIRGDVVDQIFARISSGGTVAWYLQDQQMSVRVMVDNTGAVKERIFYDGFGNIYSDTNPSFGDRYKYTGRELDSATGFQLNAARYYSGSIGRWTTQDPLGFGAGDVNLYRYGGNSAPNATDPTGMDEAAVPGLIESERRTQAVLEQVEKALNDPGYAQSSNLPGYVKSLLNSRLSYQEIETLIRERTQQEVAREIHRCYVTSGRPDPAIIETQRRAADDKFWAEYFSSYQETLDARFWQTITAFNAVLQTAFTLSAPIQAGVIYTGLYAATGNYEKSTEAAVGAATYYGSWKVLSWGGRLLGRAFRAPRAFDPFVGTGSNAGFGRLIGWGTGAEQATARTACITLQEIQAAGITRSVAQYWLKLYQNAVATGRGAATAAERVKLMQRVIELLGG